MSSSPLRVPPSITSRTIPTKTLNFHILESGHTPSHDRPLILLLHGFPELAFSWRKVIPSLANAGYYVVAPDQRGFGRTTGWDTRPFHEVDLSSFSPTSFVRDMIVLVHALGYRSVRCVVGNDLGAVTASMCVVMRPDFFRSVVLISHPFNGTPVLPFDTASTSSNQNGSDSSSSTTTTNGADSDGKRKENIHSQLASLNRKHYQRYYSTAPANEEMTNPPTGLHNFLRGYFYLKSGSWPGNKPYPLKTGAASELVSQLPYYYIMPLNSTMPESVSLHVNQEEQQIETAKQRSQSWLSDEDLAVYVAEYARTGFQGGLNWYRVQTAPDRRYTWDYEAYAGRKIEVPCSFVSGMLDWGIYKETGALEKMSNGSVCSDFRELRLVDGVGHWAPQESPGEVVEVILRLVKDVVPGDTGR